MRADLCLVGFGNVGRRFARLLDEQAERLASDYRLTCRIVAVATRRTGLAADPAGVDVARLERAGQHPSSGTPRHGDGDGAAFRAIAALAESDADLRVMVETTTLDIEAGQPAIDHVRAALDAGCHAITANKGPAAFAYHDLRSRADKAGLSFLFEGAVMDGVPVFNLVRETLPAVTVNAFRGVLNSTTNHILTALEDGEEFGPALARMQADGIAEADASLDVDGWDAAAKAAVLANVLFDARITPHDVDRTGIAPAVADAVRAARAGGRAIRLVASGARGVKPSVRPVELPGDDLLAGLRGMANAIVLDTDLLGEIAVSQLDGGLTQTAYALVSDLITIRRRSL